MDFNLNFGKFFGPQIDVFEKFLLPDFELQLEVRSEQIVILLRENAIHKIVSLALKWGSMDNMKKTRKNRLESIIFFKSIFERFWSQLGWILASKLELQKLIQTALFPSCVQEASKRRPRGFQERPKSAQERPKSAQERSKRAQGTPKVPPEGHFFADFLVFQCFSVFFCVFVRFPVFSVFFYSVPPLTFPPCRAS